MCPRKYRSISWRDTSVSLSFSCKHQCKTKINIPKIDDNQNKCCYVWIGEHDARENGNCRRACSHTLKANSKAALLANGLWHFQLHIHVENQWTSKKKLLFALLCFHGEWAVNQKTLERECFDAGHLCMKLVMIDFYDVAFEFILAYCERALRHYLILLPSSYYSSHWYAIMTPTHRYHVYFQTRLALFFPTHFEQVVVVVAVVVVASENLFVISISNLGNCLSSFVSNCLCCPYCQLTRLEYTSLYI